MFFTIQVLNLFEQCNTLIIFFDNVSTCIFYPLFIWHFRVLYIQFISDCDSPNDKKHDESDTLQSQTNLENFSSNLQVEDISHSFDIAFSTLTKSLIFIGSRCKCSVNLSFFINLQIFRQNLNLNLPLNICQLLEWIHWYVLSVEMGYSLMTNVSINR